MAHLRDNKLLKKMAIVLKQVREERGLSQEDVYNDTNIHIGRLETAKANPTVSTISYLCDYYKINLSEFYRFTEKI